MLTQLLFLSSLRPNAMKNTAFKPGNLVIALFFAIYLWAGWSQSTFSQRFATQDLILFDSLNADGGIGNTVNLADSLIAVARAYPKDTAHFPGGGMFINTDSLWGDVANDSLLPLLNTTVQCGFFQYADSFGNPDFKYAVLVTSNLTLEPETMGNGDYLEFDLSALRLPFLQPGDTNNMRFTMVQFLASTDTTLETNQTDLGILEIRAQDTSLVKFLTNSVFPEWITAKWVIESSLKARMAIKTILASGGFLMSLIPQPVVMGIGIGAMVAGALLAIYNVIGDLTPEIIVPAIPPTSSSLCILIKKNKEFECRDNGCAALGKDCELETNHRQSSSYEESSARCNCKPISTNVKSPNQTWAWEIIPNPSGASPEIVLWTSLPLEGSIEILDLDGKLTWTSGKWKAEIGQETRFKPEIFIPGIYLVKLESNHSPSVEVRRMIIIP